MHEQSETIQGPDERWYNIYGKGTGASQPMPLPKVLGFEQNSYPTEEQASNIAAWRSQLGEGQYPAQSPAYGFTNTYQPSPQAQALGKVVEALQDPRNSWMGLGPLSAVSRPIGWGAEALRRYKLLGGTPETLNKTLALRPVAPSSRNEIVAGFREATDLAAPNTLGSQPAQLQGAMMGLAGDELESTQRVRFIPRALPIERGLTRTPLIESGTQGNAAYGAVSRQAGRIMDEPGFGFKKSKYGPTNLIDKFHKTPADRISDLTDKAIDAADAGNETRANSIMERVTRLGDKYYIRPTFDEVNIDPEALRSALSNIRFGEARPNVRATPLTDQQRRDIANQRGYSPAGRRPR